MLRVELVDFQADVSAEMAAEVVDFLPLLANNVIRDGCGLLYSCRLDHLCDDSLATFEANASMPAWSYYRIRRLTQTNHAVLVLSLEFAAFGVLYFAVFLLSSTYMEQTEVISLTLRDFLISKLNVFHLPRIDTLLHQHLVIIVCVHPSCWSFPRDHSIATLL